MKKITTSLLVLASFVLASSTIKAQEICMVTSDYQTGEHYLIFWEQFDDLTGLDSVLIYRQTSTIPYTYVGGEKIGPNEVTYYLDSTSDAKAFAKYVMYVKDSSGSITGPSDWHQPISLDYSSSGEFSFTPYQKENGSFYYYSIYYDATGLGQFQNLNTNINYTLNTFIDTGYASHPDAYYYMESYIQSCEVETKAEINTSRSNIKQQIATAALGLEELNAVSHLKLFPNPANDQLHVISESADENAVFELLNVTGEVVLKGTMKGKETVLNLVHLAPGFYTVSVKLENQRINQPFVKQ